MLPRVAGSVSVHAWELHYSLQLTDGGSGLLCGLYMEWGKLGLWKQIIKAEVARIVRFVSQLWYSRKHNNIVNKLGLGCAKLRSKFTIC